MLHCLHKNVRAEQLLSTCVMKRSPSQLRPFKLSECQYHHTKECQKIDLWCLESCFTDCKNCGLHSCCKYCNVHFFLFCLLKVKIWFQNKRSKYKKIMKHGPSGPEGELLHTTSSSSPCSPGLSQLWEVSMANKVPPMHPSSLSEQLRALVSPAPPGSSAQTSDDVIEIRNTEPERLHSVSTPNLWRVSPLRCSYVFYCLLCLKRQFYSRWLPITLSFSTFTDLLQCAWNKGFMKGQKCCYVMNDLLRCIYSNYDVHRMKVFSV